MTSGQHRLGVREDWRFGIGLLLAMYVVVPLIIWWCFS